MRRFALLFFSWVLCGCGGSTTGAGDGGSDATNGDDGTYEGCPRNPPTPGTTCTVATTTHCKYGPQCGAPTYACDQLGNWQNITDQIPPVPCPDTMPDSGDTCPMCFDPSMTCGYDAGCGDGGILSTRCKNDTWEYFCAPPGDDGGPEGGEEGGSDASPGDGGGSG